MNKPTLILIAVLPCASLLLARRAVDDMPQRIDGDGHLLRMRMEGQGSPAVVMEIGLGGPLEEWAAVQPEVAKFTRAVAYDRIGSHYHGETLTGREIAADLHVALTNAGVPPPYVLVGQSMGGVYIRIFASMYPDEVAGLVLLDPAQERFIEWMKTHYPKEEFTNRVHKNWPEATGVRATLEELRFSGSLPDVPVSVVTGTRHDLRGLWHEVLPVWSAMHVEWAKSLPQGRHVITEKSGHGIHVEQPELVVDLIREIVNSARHSNSQAAAGQPSQRGAP